jgi:hypothetical protein
VTDLAWPHVAGVRYWVANGATIIAHNSAQTFLQSVVDRHWTRAPDLLEQRRKTAKLKFIGVDSAYTMANGAITVHPIDGIGSECALMAFLVRRSFYGPPIAFRQQLSLRRTHWRWSAVKRDGLTPESTAAEHLPLTAWTKIEDLHTQAISEGTR